MISYELDVAASIELEPMDDQAVGSPLGAFDPTSQPDITSQEDVDSSYPPPGFSRGQAPFARSYEDPQQLAAAAPPPTLTVDTGEGVPGQSRDSQDGCSNSRADLMREKLFTG